MPPAGWNKRCGRKPIDVEQKGSGTLVRQLSISRHAGQMEGPLGLTRPWNYSPSLNIRLSAVRGPWGSVHHARNHTAYNSLGWCHARQNADWAARGLHDEAMRRRLWSALRARRAVRVARLAARRRLMTLCLECSHPWIEHRGANQDADADGHCGECDYEVDHGFRTRGSECMVQAPTNLSRPPAPA